MLKRPNLDLVYSEGFADEIRSGNVEAKVRFVLAVGETPVLGPPPRAAKEFGVTYMNNLLQGVLAAFDGAGHSACFAEDLTCLVFQPITGTDQVLLAEEMRSPKTEEMASPRSAVPASSEEFKGDFRWGVTDVYLLAAEFVSTATQLHDRVVEVDQSCANHRFLTGLQESIDATRRAFKARCTEDG